MATQDLERLVVQLSADIKKYENSLNRAMGVTNQRAKAIESRFAKMNKTLSNGTANAAIAAGKAFALIGGAAGAQNLIDSSIKIENALKVAGLEGENLTKTYDKLFASAQKNAAPIESLVQLYSRVSLAQAELGVTSDEIAELTDNVGKSLRLTGGDAQSASGALLQLAQTLGGGKVQAEEYNSLIDGMPGILMAASAGIKQAGGSVAELTKLVKAGKISSKAFFDGIQAGSYVLDEKLSGATETISQKFIKLQNSLTKAAGAFNKSSHAANTFGSAVDNVATHVNAINMDELAEEIGKIIAILNQGSAAAQNFGAWIGKLSGLENVGAGIIGALDSDGDGKLSAFGGMLTVESTIKAGENLNRLTERRLAIEKKIADLKADPLSYFRGATIKQFEKELSDLQGKIAAAADRPGAIPGGPLDYARFPPPKSAGNKFTPVDITDSKYTVPDDGKGGKKGDAFKTEIRQIQDRTLALQAETAAQEKLNPLLNDFGYAVEFAAAKQDLLNAAKEAGKPLNATLIADIDRLADGYATAAAGADKLAATQDKVREQAEFFGDAAMDAFNELIPKIQTGNKALDGFLNTLIQAVAQAALLGKGPFGGASGGGMGGIIGAIFSGIFHKGGVVGGPAPSRAVSPGVFAGAPRYHTGGVAGLKPGELPAILQKGEIVLPRGTKMGGGSAKPSMTNVYNIDARGADQAAVARLERGLAERDRTFGNRVAGVRQNTDVRKIRPR